MQEGGDEEVLEGTTRKVYRYIYRQTEPVGIHDVQRGLRLSSPSVADYHIKKLLRAGLLKEVGDGYQANRMAFENLVRVRNRALPLQTAYAVFFFIALVALVTVLRPNQVSSLYVFSLILAVAALGISILESYRAAKVF